MPTYQYACPDCSTQFERTQRFTDPPISVCPSCGGANVYRVVGKIAVTFKGSGWYITDSRQSNKNGSSNKSDANGAAKESATEASTAKETATSGSTASA